MAIDSFKGLIVWQKSMTLVQHIYRITKALPASERFGISSQLQRAAVSIPSNIAEGSKRSSRADFRQFCKIALGSAAEVETQLLIVKQVYPDVTVNTELQLISEIQKMLTSLSNRLDEKLSTIN